MIVGHSVQMDGKIKERCVNETTGMPLLYDIDVGMSRFMFPFLKRMGIGALEIFIKDNTTISVNHIYI